MVERARAGALVVRLKGGDPFVFGRGGEEALALRAAGIEYEVVPGVTAGIAAAAYAGIPVTHRGRASAVALVTAHEEPGEARAGARLGGARALPRHARLLHGGAHAAGARRAADRRRARPRPSRRPSIARGTLPDQRDGARHARDDRAGRRQSAGIAAPAVTVIGEVAALARRARVVAAAGRSPGATVAVTRARAQASRARRRGCARSARGARDARDPDRARPPATLPALARLRPRLPDEPQRRLDPLRAARRARRGRARARRRAGRGDRARHGAGAARARRHRRRRAGALRRRGARRGARRASPCQRALIARAASARDVLLDALRARGAEVEVVALYETVAEPLDRARARGARGTPTTSPSRPPRRCASSSSSATPAPATRIVSIGPGDERDAARAGLEPHVEAERHDIDGARRGARRRPRGAAAQLTDAGTRCPADHVPVGLRRMATNSWVLHAVIARRCPRARVIDLAHGVAAARRPRGCAGAVRGAPLLRRAGVHLAVVDPGVGGARRAVALRVARASGLLVGPDNGLLDAAARAFGGVVEAVEIGGSPERLRPISATFHGRDVFAPVAAALADGARLRAVGEAVEPEPLVALALPARAARDGARCDRARAAVDGYRQPRARRDARGRARGGLRDGAACMLVRGDRATTEPLRAHVLRRRRRRAARLRRCARRAGARAQRRLGGRAARPAAPASELGIERAAMTLGRSARAPAA